MASKHAIAARKACFPCAHANCTLMFPSKAAVARHMLAYLAHASCAKGDIERCAHYPQMAHAADVRPCRAVPARHGGTHASGFLPTYMSPLPRKCVSLLWSQPGKRLPAIQ